MTFLKIKDLETGKMSTHEKHDVKKHDVKKNVKDFSSNAE